MTGAATYACHSAVGSGTRSGARVRSAMLTAGQNTTQLSAFGAWDVQLGLTEHEIRNSYLHLLLIEGHALHDVQARRLVRLRVGVICCLKDCLVLCAGAWKALVSNGPFPTASTRARGVCATYAVLFLLPLGCRSDELLWKDESGSALSLVSSICTAESAVLRGELEGGPLFSFCC